MRRITLANAVLFIVVAQALLMALLNSRSNTDLFLGLAAGREIFAGHLAAPDQFSFTHAGGMWIDQAWLSNLIYYLSYVQMGEYGPVFLKLLLLLGCVAILSLRCRDAGSRGWATCVSLYLGLMAVAPFTVIRAENFGVFYFVLFVWLLQASRLSKSVRYLGILVAIVLWSNSHGSYMLGIALLGLKIALVAARKTLGFARICSDEADWRCAKEWSIVLVCSCVLASFLSPFGLDNLIMPFVQVGAGQVTASSADWLPLLTSLFSGTSTGSSSVIFYLLCLTVFVLSLLIVLVTVTSEANETSILRIGKEPFLARAVSRTDFDWMMETAIVIITLVLAFRFKRLIAFSAFALVPALAVVLTVLARRLSDRFRARDKARSESVTDRMAAIIAAAALCLVTGWILFGTTLIRYFPNNPVTPPRPMIRQLMSFDTYSLDVTNFLKENSIGGRVFAGWEVSSYLLHRTPGIRLFMDPRDQSFYPRKVISDFFKILGIHQAPEPERLDLLDTYGVSTVVLTTDPYDFNLGLALLRSGKWGCVYKDDYAMVLVRSDDPRFSKFLKQSDFAALRYSNPDARLRSEAFHSSVAFRRVDKDLLERLHALVVREPRPNYYRMIGTGFGFPVQCLDKAQVKYLVSEVQRLANISPFYRHGANEVTQSIIAILEMLAANAQRCVNSVAAARFESIRRMYEQDYATMYHMYYGDMF